MGWKNTVGQFIGIFIGVSLGAGLVTMVMGGGRQAPPQPPVVEQNVNQASKGLFDSAVANIGNERRS